MNERLEMTRLRGQEWALPADLRIRGYVEMWYRTFKDRTKQFYYSLAWTLDNLQSFIDIFMMSYNRHRRHQIRRRSPV